MDDHDHDSKYIIIMTSSPCVDRICRTMGLADTRSVSVDEKTASRRSSSDSDDAGERIVIIINIYNNWLDCDL